MNDKLARIAEAVEMSEGKTPCEIIEAFLPKSPTAAGKRLVPLKLGHDLFLSKIAHPLATGVPNWEPNDIAVALFAFTRPSADLFAMISDASYETQFYGFLDEIEIDELEGAATELLHHWFSRKSTAIGMESPHPSSQKKTADLVGG